MRNAAVGRWLAGTILAVVWLIVPNRLFAGLDLATPGTKIQKSDRTAKRTALAISPPIHANHPAFTDPPGGFPCETLWLDAGWLGPFWLSCG
jgi:hypothetical protein